MIPFPPLAPSELSFTQPRYPVLHNVWRGSAVESPELLGDLAAGATMRLRYRNIQDIDALALLTLWSRTGGGFLPLNPLPPELEIGFKTQALANRVLRPPGLVWTFARPPRMESVKAGRRNVDIELIAEFRT